jgi:hypothetical protein
MILGRILLAAVLAFGTASAAVAADRCLSRAEQRARAAAHAVVPLSRAMRAVRKRGEVIRARLCEHTGHLVYLLTVLERDGRVALASVDAASGTLVAAHPHEKAGKDKTAKAAKDKDARDKAVKDNDDKDRTVTDQESKDTKDKDAKDAKDAKDKEPKIKDAQKAPK